MILVYWRAIEVRLRVRYADIKPGAKNYFDGRVMLHFKDKVGKVVKPESEMIPNELLAWARRCRE